ncbi:MAG: hypothetical protein ACR2NU_06955, partial [Aeoliella sp.]
NRHLNCGSAFIELQIDHLGPARSVTLTLIDLMPTISAKPQRLIVSVSTREELLRKRNKLD